MVENSLTNNTMINTTTEITTTVNEKKKRTKTKKNKVWETEDDLYLGKMYGNIRTEDLSKHFNVSKQSIERRVQKLGLKMTDNQKENLSGKRKWTEKEDKKVIKYYGKVDKKLLAKKLKRSEYALRKRAEKLGVSAKKTEWSIEAIEYIESKWGLVAVETIGKRFNLTSNQVRNIARFLDLGEERKANNNVFTVRDVAEITGQSLHQVNYAIKVGYLPSKYFRVKTKKYIQVTYDNLCKYLKDEKHCNLANADVDTLRPYFCEGFENTTNTIRITIDENVIESLKERIKRDKKKLECRPVNFGKDWTVKEQKEVKALSETKAYTHRQLSEIYKRPLDGVRGQLRC